MDGTTNSSYTVPPWAWLPAAICVCLPIAHWGAFEVLVGLLCAAACPAIAMRDQWRERTRINLTVAVVFVCWALWGGAVGLNAVLSTHSAAAPSSNSEKLADETYRQKVFAHTMSRMPRIEAVEQEIRQTRRQGKDVKFLTSKLKFLQDGHERGKTFAQGFFKITAAELETIVNEGIAEDWPYE